MSAWPEAVWIVKKLKKYLNFEVRMANCENKINNLNPNIQEAINEVQRIENEFDNIINFTEEINTINTKISLLENNLQEAINKINSLYKTAIFDTDLNNNENPDYADNHEQTEYIDNSIWFVEQENQND